MAYCQKDELLFFVLFSFSILVFVSAWFGQKCLNHDQFKMLTC